MHSADVTYRDVKHTYMTSEETSNGFVETRKMLFKCVSVGGSPDEV